MLARAIVRRIERGGRTCGNQNAENNVKLRNRNTSLLHQTHRQFLTGSRAIRGKHPPDMKNRNGTSRFFSERKVVETLANNAVGIQRV